MYYILILVVNIQDARQLSEQQMIEKLDRKIVQIMDEGMCPQAI